MFAKILIANRGEIACGILRAVLLLLFSRPVYADSLASGLALQCLPQVSFFSAMSVSFDDEGEQPLNSPAFFINSTASERQDDAIEIARCRLDGIDLVLTRTYVNVPHATGMCGGADWAKFELMTNRRIAATFYSGCGGSLLTASRYGLKLCVETYGERGGWDCRGLDWDSLTAGDAGPLSGPFSGVWDE